MSSTKLLRDGIRGREYYGQTKLKEFCQREYEWRTEDDTTTGDYGVGGWGGTGRLTSYSDKLNPEPIK